MEEVAPEYDVVVLGTGNITYPAIPPTGHKTIMANVIALQD
jgi:hypothetical protein